MSQRLLIVSDRDHRYLDLDGVSALSVGRAPDGDIVLKDDMVSRRHCQLEVGADGVLRVRDLKSFNGTYLNERRIREEAFAVWDAVRVGRTRLILVERSETPPGKPSRRATAPEAPLDEPTAPSVAKGEDAMSATRTVDVDEALASNEIRSIVEAVVRRERAELEQDISRRIRDESGPALLAGLSGFKARVRRVGPLDGGGDFYDIFRDDLAPDALFMALGSVSGVGVAACVAATSARHVLRGACAASTNADPRETLGPVREVLSRTLHPGSAVSLLLARLGSGEGTVRIGASGGTGALHYDAGEGKLIALRPPGRRDEEAVRAEELEATLGPDDRLVLLSDGAGSVRGQAGKPIGPDRFLEIAQALVTLSPREMAKALADELLAYADGAPDRDATVLVVARAEA